MDGRAQHIEHYKNMFGCVLGLGPEPSSGANALDKVVNPVPSR